LEETIEFAFRDFEIKKSFRHIDGMLEEKEGMA
jgi:hypothetical protein